MSSVDLKNDIVVDVALNTVSQIADEVEGNIIDMARAYGATFVVNSGGLDSAGEASIKLQHSDTTLEEGFTDVPADFLIGSIVLTAEAPENEVQSVGYVGQKRYVRCVKISGSPTGIFGAVSIKFTLRHNPSEGTGSVTPPPPSKQYLLLEDGGKILQENGFGLLL